MGQARGLDQLHDREETRRCGQRSRPAEQGQACRPGGGGAARREERTAELAQHPRSWQYQEPSSRGCVSEVREQG